MESGLRNRERIAFSIAEIEIGVIGFHTLVLNIFAITSIFIMSYCKEIPYNIPNMSLLCAFQDFVPIPAVEVNLQFCPRNE